MSKINLTYNEKEVIQQIDNLESIAKDYLMEIEEFSYLDLFFFSVVDKSLKLINPFLFSLRERNVTVLAILTRVQMDCALRTFATTLVDDSNELCKNMLVEGKQLNKIQDKNGRYLTDKYLCEKMKEYLKEDVYDLYKKVCGFVHFSSDSFYSIVKDEGNSSFSMLVGRKNRQEDKKTYEQRSVELANDFYFFGSLLIENFLPSWLKQKDEWNE